MLPVEYNISFAERQKRFAARKRGERPPPYPARVVTKMELANILSDSRRYHEGMGRWTEDVMVRSYLENPDFQILYRENSPLHKGFDLVAKYIPSGEVVVVEMKMSNKVGKIRTFLKKTKTKGRQMSMQWVKTTAQEIREDYPLAYREIMGAIDKGLLRRSLIVANHVKRPHGWLSATFGKMGMKGFKEDDFRKTPGFN